MPPSSSHNNIFHSYPQKYPKARAKAMEVVTSIHAITKKGPRTLIATVADTSFHASQGYVTATTELGILRVYSVPYGTVIPQMRIYVRQMGPQSTNRAFVFDGYAPNISGMGTTSGSLLLNGTESATLAPAFGTAIPTPGISGPNGYFWHFFFYLSALPVTPVTLLVFYGNNQTSFTVSYDTNGYLSVLDQQKHGYRSTAPAPPHQIHWIVIQPGVAASELFIDGLPIYTGMQSSTDEPTFTGNGTIYNMALLANELNDALCPIGSWISKVGFGTSLVGGTPLPVSQTIPEQDSDLPILNTTQSLYSILMGDSIGQLTLTNSATTTGGGPMLIAPPATISSLGPY